MGYQISILKPVGPHLAAGGHKCGVETADAGANDVAAHAELAGVVLHDGLLQDVIILALLCQPAKKPGQCYSSRHVLLAWQALVLTIP